ncbi:MAG: hypothetical protein U0840_12335 [Gemmataceae bacterium]
MNDWFRISIADSQVHVKFLLSLNRFWPPEVLRQRPLPMPEVAGTPVTLTGAGAVWMYAHAAAVLRAAGAREVRVLTPRRPGESDDLEGSTSQLVTAGHRHCGALLSISLRPFPPLCPAAVDLLLEPRLEELSRLRPGELTLAGRASAEVYARAALAAIDGGVRRISCWSARDGLVVVFDPDGAQVGCTIARPDWLAQAMPRPVRPVVVGVAGDPNRGKSVFSAVLDWYRERIGCDGWKLDCDGQAPTPPWYLSMVGQMPEAEVLLLREAHKRPWTPEMEADIARQIRLAREIFSVLIADLPGGNHKVSPAQRVPPGRERIFAENDAIVLLAGDNNSEQAWREALRPHGLDGRIAAVLRSSEPDALPALVTNQVADLWRGEVRGLDRKRTTAELGEAFRPGLDRLWPALLDPAHRRYRA